MIMFVILFIVIIYDIVKNIRKNSEKEKERERVTEITSYHVAVPSSPTKLKNTLSSTDASESCSEPPNGQ